MDGASSRALVASASSSSSAGPRPAHPRAAGTRSRPGAGTGNGKSEGLMKGGLGKKPTLEELMKERRKAAVKGGLLGR